MREKKIEKKYLFYTYIKEYFNENIIEQRFTTRDPRTQVEGPSQGSANFNFCRLASKIEIFFHIIIIKVYIPGQIVVCIRLLELYRPAIAENCTMWHLMGFSTACLRERAFPTLIFLKNKSNFDSGSVLKPFSYNPDKGSFDLSWETNNFKNQIEFLIFFFFLTDHLCLSEIQ